MGTKHSKSLSAKEDRPRPAASAVAAIQQQQIQSSPSIVVDGRTYHDIGSSAYCLPRDELEQDRLNSQHFSLKVIFDGNVLPVISSKLTPEALMLDVGCGSSTWCLEMAIEYPRAKIRGLDMADMFPATIRPHNVEFDLHNALDGLPYPTNSFDFVHMRLLIAGWRADEWAYILKEIYRVLKPGGFVQLVESNFTEAQNHPMVEHFNKILVSTLQERGHDPFIVQHLEGLLVDGGFELLDKQLKTVNYGERGNPISQEMLWNWKMAMKSLKPLLGPKLLRQQEDYPFFIDRYIQECEQSGLIVQLGAFAARKPPLY
ncbi:S-adenosyl-L-methionine-dependent methyltransferase [Hesseltinella vesiculosa]|uniref:S-adenosyl-L-methionine-dependent methyltransferase n=1 Tax=Hesseltinella vesiculosa TaxID=101127 RepID=A0A1X2G4T5_9FUNG|nr:S-adenosyl-L-methionine-dependent methyltransferase [Hesseltinella vesiculosa]